MKIFLIQTVNKEVIDDFAYTLIDAIKFHTWYYGKNVYDYILSGKIDTPRLKSQMISIGDLIPVGDIKYVKSFLEKYYGIKDIAPINIPEELSTPKYLQRNIEIVNAESFTSDKMLIKDITDLRGSLFIKDISMIKGESFISTDKNELKKGNYLISEYIDIDSEWRAFVFNNEMVGLQNYHGDFTCFPNVESINSMINKYNYPYAYTLDVGVNSSGTFIIECHDFFSCGLYGFSNSSKIPLMLINAFNKLISKNLKTKNCIHCLMEATCYAGYISHYEKKISAGFCCQEHMNDIMINTDDGYLGKWKMEYGLI